MKLFEAPKHSDPKILKLTEGNELEVQAFEYASLNKTGESQFFQTPTLGQKVTRNDSMSAPVVSQRDRLFKVDPVLEGLLSADAQTAAQVEEKVAARVAEIQVRVESEAFAKGEVEGFQAGETKARVEFDTKANLILGQLTTLVDGFEGIRTEIVRANEEFFMQMVFRVSKEVLKREIATDPEYLRRLVHRIVEEVGTREQIKILVHPDRLAQVIGLKPELEKKYASLKSVAIEGSAELTEMDCIVETDFSRVDATWSTQLENLYRALTEQELKPE